MSEPSSIIVPNKALADALLRSVVIQSQPVQTVEENILSIADRMKTDTIDYNGLSGHKNTHTIAALLAYSGEFRRFAQQRNINIYRFDQEIAMLRMEWQTAARKEPSGAKFTQVLRRLCGI